MTNVHPIIPDGAAARLEQDVLVLDNFRERDAQVITLARESENLDSLVHDCLGIGARAMSAAQATTDVAVVEKAFGAMTNAFTRGLDEFSVELDAKTKDLLDDEEGALPRSFQEF